MSAKATAGHSRQRRDLMKGRSDQGVTTEQPPDTLVNPLRESLIRPAARWLHPLGALARTNMSEAKRDLPPVTSIRARG
jgi:hypothetical protein